MAKITRPPLKLASRDTKITPREANGLAAASAANVWGARRHVAQRRGCDLCRTTIFRRSIVPPSASIVCSRCSTGSLEASRTRPTYPPYNIERTGENAYRITLAVAGFAENELSVETRENTLTVRGSKETAQKDEKREVLYQGIAARAFERRFQLADHVVVTGAASENGLLHIDLVREVPEAQKPRTIAINKGAKTIESVKAPAAQAA